MRKGEWEVCMHDMYVCVCMYVCMYVCTYKAGKGKVNNIGKVVGKVVSKVVRSIYPIAYQNKTKTNFSAVRRERQTPDRSSLRGADWAMMFFSATLRITHEKPTSPRGYVLVSYHELKIHLHVGLQSTSEPI